VLLVAVVLSLCGSKPLFWFFLYCRPRCLKSFFFLRRVSSLKLTNCITPFTKITFIYDEFSNTVCRSRCCEQSHFAMFKLGNGETAGTIKPIQAYLGTTSLRNCVSYYSKVSVRRSTGGNRHAWNQE
jgi:hypothetical protein